jgi:hypothetical protein
VARLTSLAVDEEQSVWSPDGLQVAFKRFNESWVLRDLVSGREEQITDDPGAANPFNTQPAWSADGRTCSCAPTARTRCGGPATSGSSTPTRRARPSGSSRACSTARRRGAVRHGRRRHGRGAAHARRRGRQRARLVADGTRLAFESTRDGEDHELCTPDLDSGTVTRLTDNDVPATCRSPSGVASVVAVELRCRRAVGLARRWQLRAQQAGRRRGGCSGSAAARATTPSTRCS